MDRSWKNRLGNGSRVMTWVGGLEVKLKECEVDTEPQVKMTLVKGYMEYMHQQVWMLQKHIFNTSMSINTCGIGTEKTVEKGIYFWYERWWYVVVHDVRVMRRFVGAYQIIW